MNEYEESEEEMEVTNIVKKFVVDINEVRCTILYPGESLVSIAQNMTFHNQNYWNIMSYHPHYK